MFFLIDLLAAVLALGIGIYVLVHIRAIERRFDASLGGKEAGSLESALADYIARVEATGLGVVDRNRLSPREAATERLLMGLRTDEGVAWSELAVLALGPRHPVVADLAAGGWLAVGAERIAATAKGRRVLDHITGELSTAAPRQADAVGR